MFDIAHMTARIQAVDSSIPDYEAKICDVVTDLLIEHMNKQDLRLDILERDANQFYRRLADLEQKQPPTEAVGGTRTL